MSSTGAIARILIERRWLVCASFVVAIAYLGAHIADFRIDASAETLLTRNNPLYIQTQIANKRFAPREFILVAYQPKSGEIFSESIYRKIDQLSQQISSLERVDFVTTILDVPLLNSVNDLSAIDGVGGLTWRELQPDRDEMIANFRDHPIYTGVLVNSELTATALQIVFRENPELTSIEDEIATLQAKVLDNTQTEEESERVDQLQEKAMVLRDAVAADREQEIQALYTMLEPYRDDADIFLGGAHVLRHHLIDIIRHDLFLFGIAIAGMICVLLGFLFRRLRWVVLPILCCAVSLTATMGLFGLLNLRTTVISSNFVALQLILTLAIVIHLIVRYRELSKTLAAEGHEHKVQETFRSMVMPCFFAGITTSVGFGSLMVSGIEPVIAFGWMMIIATLISIPVSLVLFPAVLSFFDNPETRADERRMAKSILDRCATAVKTRRGVLYSTALAALLVAAAGLPRLNVENSFINYFSKSTEAHQELAFIDRDFGGSTPMDIILDIPADQQHPELVISAQTVQLAQKIQHVLTQYNATGTTLSIVNFAELAKQVNRNAPLTEYELTVVYRLIDESLRERLIGSYFAPEHAQLRISSRIQDTTEGLDRAEYLEQLRSDMASIGVDPDDYRLTNLFILYQDILHRLFKSQILTLGLVFAAIWLVLLALFRSIRIACIAIVPNVFSTVFILGFIGWAGIPLDLMTITICAIAMGIAIDDTIHFVYRYRKERREAGADEAIDNTFHSVGYAIIYTSVVIAAGFSVLALSDFLPSVYFGLLTGLTMIVALVSNVTILPALLHRFSTCQATTSP